VRIQAVVFDAAGTLIEPAEPIGETYARRARAHAVALPAARLGDAFRRVLAAAPPNVHPGESAERALGLERSWWRERVRETFRAADGTARFDDFDAFFAELFAHFGRGEAWHARPGAQAALSGLRAAGRRTAVVSNFDQRLHGILRELGLARELACVVLPADCGAAKPDPRIFAACLARLALPAERCVYVGDRSDLDVAAARAAGLRAIDVADVATLAELPARIEAMERENA
jgi:putative hydrolase of the HAD superfamily